ncbi:MAG: glycosyltransferase family 39 protein [Kiritimatiellia bacterium]
MKNPLSKAFTWPSVPSFLHIVLYVCCLWGGEYVLRDLWEPDEARYAYVSQEMLDDGHLLVPHRHGEPYAHKPPLNFWINQIFAQLNGGTVTPFTTRIPSLIGAVLSLYVTSRFAAVLFGGLSSWFAPLILSTGILFWKTNGMGQMDALLCGLEMMAVWLLYQAEAHPDAKATRRRMLAFLCMGLAVLNKGPVGFLVPLGSWIVFGSLLRPQGRIKRLPLLWGSLIALTPVVLWIGGMIAFEHAPQSYIDELLFKQNVGRVTGEMGKGHINPPWYFLENFFIDFLPWLFLFPTALVALFRSGRDRKEIIALLGWIGFVVLFFSLSASKRNLYILSIYPAVSILTAAGWERLSRAPGWALKCSKLFFTGLLLSLGVAGLIMSVALLLVKPDIPLPPGVLIPSSLLVLGTGILLVQQFKASPFNWLRIAGIGWALSLISVEFFLYPALNPIKSPHSIRAASREYLPEGQPLLLYKLMGEIQTFNAKARGKQVHDVDSLRETLQNVESSLIVLRERDWPELRDLPEFTHAPTQTYQMGGKTLRWVAYTTSKPGYRPGTQ